MPSPSRAGALVATGAEAVARIHQAVRRIPAGFVTTYGDVATAAGLPGRARLVGRSLGETADGEPLPWYRVIAAGGRIALPEGSKGRAEQLRRLKAEGVVVKAGKVDMKRFGWRRSDAPVVD
ncbi:MGMT family protein [Hydrocarboniphaga sp.]|uniref:MGMT family protein n=1 Tax=Hydrocarboniphaga sp. TaxID=2033016 RepID=UPI003D0E5585